MSDTIETYSDQIIGFTLPGRSARGRVVRLEGVLDNVRSAHDYPAPSTHRLGEALARAMQRRDGAVDELTLQKLRANPLKPAESLLKGILGN